MFSYNMDHLSDSLKEQVRLKLGDTDEEDVLLQDEEIYFLLEENEQNLLQALLQAVETIIAKLAREVDFKIGPYTESHGTRLNYYRTLYNQLKQADASTYAPLIKDPTTTPVFHYDMFRAPGEGHD